MVYLLSKFSDLPSQSQVMLAIFIAPPTLAVLGLVSRQSDTPGSQVVELAEP